MAGWDVTVGTRCISLHLRTPKACKQCCGYSGLSPSASAHGKRILFQNTHKTRLQADKSDHGTGRHRRRCGNLVDDLRPSLEMRRRPSMTMVEPRLVGPFPREMARDGQMESQRRRDSLSPSLQSLVNSRVSRSEAGSTLGPQTQAGSHQTSSMHG
jgi:hypothetical protein